MFLSTSIPLVSIITLNWNATKVTCEFLESVRRLRYPKVEVLVCDMNSEIDPTIEIMSHAIPGVKVLRSNSNLGFSGGNNWGIKQAKGDFIFIVNNDTELTPDIIENLLDPFTRDASIAVVCPKIRFFHNPLVIQYAGFNPINNYTGRTTAIGNKEVDKGQHDFPGYTHGAHGCAMMVKKEIIEKTGAFPEVFFLYYEEWDWSSRILKEGYTIFFQPRALIYHKESISVGKANPMKVYYQTRNRILFMRRNSDNICFFIFFLFYTFIALPKSLIKFFIMGKFAYLNSTIKGALWNLWSPKYSKIN